MPQTSSSSTLLEIATKVLSQSSSTLNQAIAQFKRNWAKNKKWNAALVKEAEAIKALIKKAVSDQFQTRATTSNLLTQAEQDSYIAQIKSLENSTIKIFADGYQQQSLATLTTTQLTAVSAFRILPNSGAVAASDKTQLLAHLHISVNKNYVADLARAIATMITTASNAAWIEQAVLVGVTQTGNRLGDALITLNATGIAHLDSLVQQLQTLLPQAALRDELPIGMRRVATGFAYAESVALKKKASDSTSNDPIDLFLPSLGEKQVSDITAALAEHLLADAPPSVEQALANRLQQKGHAHDDSTSIAPNIKNILLGTPHACLADRSIQKFTASPDRFILSNQISTENLFDIEGQHWLSSSGYVKFSKVSTGSYQVVRAEKQGIHTIDAYFLGLNKNPYANDYTAYIDIPSSDPSTQFLFIEKLNSSSVVVTQLNDTTLRVYHDAHYDTKKYNNVLMEINSSDYLDTEKASAYMYYAEGKWKLALQTQSWESTQHSSNTEAYTLHLPWVQTPKALGTSNTQPDTTHAPITPTPSTSTETTHTNRINRLAGVLLNEELLVERSALQKAICNLADILNVLHTDVEDTAYTAGAYSLDHPSIANWEALRQRLSLVLAISQQQAVPGSNMDLLYPKIKSLIHKSRAADCAWLYQNKVDTGDTPSVEPISLFSANSNNVVDIEDIYSDYMLFISYRDSSEFKRGYETYGDFNLSRDSENFSSTQLKQMSCTELKELVLQPDFSIAQYGALFHYVEQAHKKELLTSMMRDHEDEKTAIFLAGAQEVTFIPQLALLESEDFTYGRCLPLVGLLAIALEEGSASVERLRQKVVEAYKQSPQNRDLFKNSLQQLHGSIGINDSLTSVTAPSSTSKEMSFADIATHLGQQKNGSYFLLETRNHAMLVCRKANADGKSSSFYFYDPNKFLVSCGTEDELNNICDYLVDHQLAEEYASYGSPGEPKFHVYQINTTKFRQIQLDRCGLSAEDLVVAPDLSVAVDAKKIARQNINNFNVLENDAKTQRITGELGAMRKAHALRQATEKLIKDNQLNGEWVPTLRDIKKGANNHYQLTLINQQGQSHAVTTTDPTFLQTQQYVDNKLTQFKTHYSFDGTAFHQISALPDLHTPGISEWLALQMLIQHLYNPIDRNNSLSPSLARALTVHCYLNVIQIGTDVTHSATQFASLWSTLLQNTGGSTVNRTGIQAFSHSFSRINGLASLGFGVASVLLDAYELSKAENTAQKSLFATQLVFDIAGVSVNIAGIVAGMVGATTASALLSAGGVILGGLAVGCTSLAQAYGELAQKSQGIIDHLSMIANDRANHGYYYQEDQDVWCPYPTTIIKKLNINRSMMELDFDSQRIYKYHYEFLNTYIPNFFSSRANARAEAIDLYQALHYTKKDSLTITQDTSILLPATPLHYMRLEYLMMLHVMRTDTDERFHIIDQLESQYPDEFRFQYFSAGIYKRVAIDMFLEFVDTTIEVTLKDVKRHLIIPELSRRTQLEILRGYITYSLNNEADSTHIITLNEGVTLDLKSTVRGAGWVLDTSQLSNETVQVFEHHLVVGGITIRHNDQEKDDVWIIHKNGDVKKVNFEKKKVQIVNVDDAAWRAMQSNAQTTIEQHIQDLQNKNLLQNQYVLINDYVHHHSSTTSNHYIGRAFYDSKNKQTLFSHIESLNKNQTQQLETLLNDVQQAAQFKLIQKHYRHYRYGFFKDTNKIESKYLITSPKVEALKRLKSHLSTLTTDRSTFTAVVSNLNNFIHQWEAKLSTWNNGRENCDYKKVDSRSQSCSYLNANEFNINSASDAASHKNVFLGTLQKEFNDAFSPQMQSSFSTINAELLRAKFVNSIELAGVVDNYAYFYNPNYSSSTGLPWIWRSEVGTGTIDARFSPLFDIRITRAWNEVGTLYIACQYNTSTSTEGCELIYRIQGDRLELTHILGNPAMFDQLERVKGYENNLQSLLLNCFASTAPSATNTLGLTAREINTDLASSLMLFGKNSAGVERHYWWRKQDGAVIRPNLPASAIGHYQLSDIELTGSTTTLSGEEVFYFFDRARKQVWKQNGTGVNQKSAELIKIDQLRDFLSVGHNFFALTQDGLVKRLDEKNHLHLEGVHVEWLHQHKNWRQDLITFARQHAVTALTVFGIRDQQGRPIPVWYCNGIFVIAPSSLQDQSLKFLGLDTLGIMDIGEEESDDAEDVATVDIAEASNQTSLPAANSAQAGNGYYGFLLNTKTGKLYVQPIVNSQTLQNLIGKDKTVLNKALIPKAKKIFSGYTFASAELRNGKPRLTTINGEIVVIKEKNQLELIGVTKTWENGYASDLDFALRHLSRTWFAGVEHEFERNAEGLLFVKNTQTELFGISQRLDNTILIEGTANDDAITPKSLAGVDVYYLSGEAGADTYTLNQIWPNAKITVIDNYDPSTRPKQDKAQLHVNNIDTLLVCVDELDLWILDIDAGRALAIKNVIGQQNAAQRHLELNFSDNKKNLKVNIDNMINQLQQGAKKNSPLATNNSQKQLIDSVVKELRAKLTPSATAAPKTNLVQQVDYLLNMAATSPASTTSTSPPPSSNSQQVLLTSPSL